jgi:hypothetical protein
MVWPITGETPGFGPLHLKDTAAASQRMMLWPGYARTLAL